MNESYHTYISIYQLGCAGLRNENESRTHMWVSHVSKLAYEWDMPYVWTSHSLRTWMSHELMCEWVMSQTKPAHEWVMHSHMRTSHSLRTWMSHELIYGWVMSRSLHTNEACILAYERVIPYAHEWVTSHIWRSHVSHKNESRHTCERVTSHIWRSHVTHANASRHTCEQVMSHVWIRHVTVRRASTRCENESWVTARMWLLKSCHTYEWVVWPWDAWPMTQSDSVRTASHGHTTRPRISWSHEMRDSWLALVRMDKIAHIRIQEEYPYVYVCVRLMTHSEPGTRSK